ncbi:hypothetical protein AB836_01695 [Rickettsiales bacterium (ex Bugula neritina AB1)]|nr:hypothetical protein AB836_01695 [Rickettsiales bacterium (ex Bugula neritina AB1)]
MTFKKFEKKNTKLQDIIKVKLLANSKPPRYLSKNTSSISLFSREKVIINSKSLCVVATGVCMSVNKKCRIDLVSPKNFQLPLLVVNKPATIDVDYRGEIKIIFFNLSNKDIVIEEQNLVGELLLIEHQKKIECERNKNVV